MPKFIRMITVYNPHHQSIIIKGKLIQPGNTVEVAIFDKPTDVNFIKALRKSGLIVTLTNRVQPEATNSFKVGDQAVKVSKPIAVKKQNTSAKTSTSTHISTITEKSDSTKTSATADATQSKTAQDVSKSETARKKPGPKPKIVKVESLDESKA